MITEGSCIYLKLRLSCLLSKGEPIPVGQVTHKFFYTPGIYAAGYIVFALTFVRSSVRMFVRSLVRSCVRSFVTFRHVRRIYIKVFG